MFPKTLVVLAIALFLAWSICAQSTTANCSSAYDWSFNSQQQSPCLVAAYLETVCSATPVLVPALPNDEPVHYLGPDFASADPCKCSTVVYSLLSACGACQSHPWTNWSDWSINCPTIEVAVFPRAIPAGTAVPTWAFINVTALPDDTFDPVRAQANVTTASSSSLSPSSTATSSTTSSITEITSAAAPPISSSGKTNAGAIAGGVVGGLAFLVLGGLLGFWLFVRKQRTTGPQEVTDLTGGEKSMSPLDDRLLYRDATSPVIQTTPYHPYNTSEFDRSTSPVSPVTSGIYTTFGRTSFETLPQSIQPHGYTGAPEV